MDKVRTVQHTNIARYESKYVTQRRDKRTSEAKEGTYMSQPSNSKFIEHSHYLLLHQ